MEANRRLLGPIGVDTHKLDLYRDDAVRVEAGSTGFHGEKSRGFVRILNSSLADFTARKIVDEKGNHGIQLETQGEFQLSALITALAFAKDALEGRLK